MFSTELTIRRAACSRRAIGAGLSLAAAAAMTAGLAYALPAVEVHDRWLHQAPWRQFALWAGSTLCLFAALAAILTHRWGARVLGHDSLQSIRWLIPREFNRLVEEGFRRQGYLVQSSERLFSRAGIDLILRKADNHILVLCRRDPDAARQLAAVQELHAATATVNGASGLLITCERIAPEVKVYAANHGVAVIEGPALLKLLERARGERGKKAVRREPRFAVALTDLPVCSECGGPMVPDSDHNLEPEMRRWHCSRGASCHTPRLA